MDAQSVKAYAQALGIELTPLEGFDNAPEVWKNLLNYVQHLKVTKTYFMPRKVASLKQCRLFK